jgi:O-acetylhomoserine/O-acetylserine sulfhydrylase-like pyridoxal-dependent enzyme
MYICEKTHTSPHRWLNAHPKVAWVVYPGLKYHPDHARAVNIFREGAFGGIVSFGIKGIPGDLVDNLKLASNLSHMGTFRSSGIFFQLLTILRRRKDTGDSSRVDDQSIYDRR